MLWTIIVILLVVWLLGGGAPLAGWGEGFGGSNIHWLVPVIVIVLILALSGRI